MNDENKFSKSIYILYGKSMILNTNLLFMYKLEKIKYNVSQMSL